MASFIVISVNGKQANEYINLSVFTLLYNVDYNSQENGSFQLFRMGK